MHCHTDEVSACGKVPAEELVEMYIQKGYDGIVITDHINASTFLDYEEENWEEKINYFLKGYKDAVEAAKGRIKILLGLELCRSGSRNDYLVYGITEEFLRKYNNESVQLMNMSVKELSQLFRENGMLFFQAHPFRNGLKVVPPEYLDGIETYNGNPRHASRNDIASLWAKKYNLLEVSGSDFHQIDDIARGGIIFDGEINSQEDLINAIKSRPELIKTETGFLKE